MWERVRERERESERKRERSKREKDKKMKTFEKTQQLSQGFISLKKVFKNFRNNVLDSGMLHFTSRGLCS